MQNLLLPHERNVVSVKGDVKAKIREEAESLTIGRHRTKTKLVLAPAITERLQPASTTRRLRLARTPLGTRSDGTRGRTQLAVLIPLTDVRNRIAP
jgi:hypothetical protein